jgi:ubiquinone/menaquinone biosynthesis C-methylase UbiE
MSDEKKIRLYIGCGDDLRAGRINVDIRRPTTIPSGIEFIQSDVRTLPFPNEYADELAATHVIEHFIDPNPILREWGRVLKKDGKLFITCPDMDRVIQYYVSGRISFEYFCMYTYGARNYPTNIHYNGFNEAHLKKVLERNGFHDVVFRKSNSVTKTMPLRAVCKKR